ncbi:MAG: recombination protein RecR [Chthonomonadales bacterium]|nr:recombination protein RecR [Chthonomonadales bacterium]
MLAYARPLARLIGELEKLPGIGPKSAQRVAYHILRMPKSAALALAEAIAEVQEAVRFCSVCFNFSEDEVCSICRDPRRNKTTICVVAEPRDLIAIEKTGEHRGLYHVLHGVISPQDGIMPEQLRIRELLQRLDQSETAEVIVATNPTVEGDATALYLSKLLKPLGIKVTRLAHGLPLGADLDYADQATIISALQWRREM